MNKGGLSQAVTTILFIALVLVLAGVIWVIVANVLATQSKNITDSSDKLLEYNYSIGVEENPSASCTSNCSGKECGSDACGGQCPPGCSESQSCNEGVCINNHCVPKTCADLEKQCGAWDDECGNSFDCGPCSGGYTCTLDGICQFEFNNTGNVLLLHFENNFLDSSGLGNNGTSYGAKFTTSSKIGSYAGSFDGSSTLEPLAKGLPGGNSPRTINFWVKRLGLSRNPASDLNQFVFSYGSNLYNMNFKIDTVDNKSYVTVQNGYGDSGKASGKTTSIFSPADGWKMVTYVFNGSNLLIYVNGSSEVNSFWGQISTSAVAPRIGCQNGYTSGFRYFNGTLDEFSIWNRTLSAEEISYLYNFGNGREI